MSESYQPERHVADLDIAERELARGGEFEVQFAAPLATKLQIARFEDAGNLVCGPQIDRAAYMKRINEMCAKWKEKFSVRFYGHHGKTFDGEILLEIPDVASLCVNCIYDSTRNLDAIGRLKSLKRLAFGVFELDDRNILRAFPLEQLAELTLEETRTKALDLAPLERAKALRSLRLFGHKKNIAAVGSLQALEAFVFNPAKTLDCGFLNNLDSLRSLKFVLGGIESIAAINQLPNLKELAITRVRGLTEIGDLQRFPFLKRLLVQDLPHLEHLQTGAGNASLRHIWIYNCPQFSEFVGLEVLPSIESLSLLNTKLRLSDFDAPKTLSHLMVYSLKRSSEAEERRAIEALGLAADAHPSMPFFYK